LNRLTKDALLAGTALIPGFRISGALGKGISNLTWGETAFCSLLPIMPQQTINVFEYKSETPKTGTIKVLTQRRRSNLLISILSINTYIVQERKKNLFFYYRKI
jgi:hypothetical protein